MMGILWKLNSTIKREEFLVKAKDLAETTARLSSEGIENSITTQHRYRIGLCILAITLLVIAGLSTGLILAICGLDQIWLHMKNITATPKERERIRVITHMKSHGTWMLCSLVICSVACSEYFPFVVQSLFLGPPWVAILISTICITIFVELVPQFFIPAYPLTWGYYCRPMIWSCMWLTAIVSWPVSLFLSHISLITNDRSVFSNDELKTFIKYHEKSEKNGGRLGREASRIMIGALNLDNCVIGKLSFGRQGNKLFDDNEAEKATQSKQKGIIKSWPFVKTINIDDIVNNDFMEKISHWSYNRLPVIGTSRRHQYSPRNNSEYHLEDIQIYGSLHLKSLLKCINKTNSSSLSVRDLPLDPLPIVRVNMSVYALLNMFENGISRMAIVIPTKKQENLALLKSMPPKISICSHLSSTDCLYTQALNFETQQHSKKCPQTRIFGNQLAEAATNSNNLEIFHSSIQGTRIIEPIGLVALDDLISAVFQRTSNERGVMYEPCSNNYSTENEPKDVIHDGYNVINSVLTSSKNDFLSQSRCSLKYHEIAAIDATDEFNFNQYPQRDLDYQSLRNNPGNSSNFQVSDMVIDRKRNSASTGYISKTKNITSLHNLHFPRSDGNPVTKSENKTFPRRKNTCTSIECPIHRNSASLITSVLPKIPRISSCSHQNVSESNLKMSYNYMNHLPSKPGPLNALKSFSSPELLIDHFDPNFHECSSKLEEKIGENKTHKYTSSGHHLHKIVDNSTPKSFSMSPKKENSYGKACANPLDLDSTCNFFKEDSEAKNKENLNFRYTSHTLPQLERTNFSLTSNRKKSSYDDRSLLPSQRRIAFKSADNFLNNYRCDSS